jgi:hypothetical protein
VVSFPGIASLATTIVVVDAPTGNGTAPEVS